MSKSTDGRNDFASVSHDYTGEGYRKFVTLIENSSDFIGMCDLEGVPFFVNRAGLDMVGLASIEDARHTTVGEFFFPEDRTLIVEQFFPKVLKNGRGEIEIRFRHFKTGQALWMAYKVVVLTDAAGEPNGYATVSQDITERKQLNDDLRRLAADLSENDRRKNEFLATLAHELRNPLAPMSNMLELVKRAAGDEAIVRRALVTIERQLGQIVRLVDDLLDLNRITHDRLELRRSEVTLSSVIQQAVEVARPLLDASSHELIIDLPEEPIYLDADGARLAQLFGNLLNNSCKYTEPNGTIRLTAECTNGDVLVKVKDNGAGIPPDKLNRIFDMFMQVEATAERSQGGLGIGLTLVKRLAEMHGGSVEARSGGAGEGSEFIVKLPILECGERSPQPVSEPLQISLPLCRVLIVDDNFDSAESLALLFQSMGSTVCLAHDGQEALVAIEQDTPDVVLLDIGLPKLNGYEVCRRVRSQPWGKDIIMIALTGWSQQEDRRMSEDAGFDRHIVKPVDYDHLLELMSSLKTRLSHD
ncbi:MAG TPA: ATP-binding protein [Pyrinomonadaceae bacterium]